MLAIATALAECTGGGSDFKCAHGTSIAGVVLVALVVGAVVAWVWFQRRIK